MPLIGVTTEVHKRPEPYLHAIREAGGDPIVLENVLANVDADARRVDGILFIGGEDVDPAYFGEAPHPKTEIVHPDRDAYEFALIRKARERDVPTFAICRGVQVANVAFGGTLIQHVPDIAGDAIRHRIETPDGSSMKGLIEGHVVAIEPDSAVAQILGTTSLLTSARHHQAIGRVAGDLHEVARTSDGIVEALEPNWPARFWIGVQWHPESTLDTDGGLSRKLFEAFVRAASR